MKRYFIVFYVGQKEGISDMVYGNCVTQTDGIYVNREKLGLGLSKEGGLHVVIVTNIVEVTESDYLTFTQLNTPQNQ